MPWHDGPTLVEALDLFRKIPPATRKPLRFPVQDVYARNGEQLVVGRVESGIVRKGQRICFLPGAQVRTVREIRQFMREDMPEAVAEECIALLLDGEAPGRGQVGCPEDRQPGLTRRLRASVPAPRRGTRGEPWASFLLRPEGAEGESPGQRPGNGGVGRTPAL